jgi:hypothetical protein
MSEKLTFDVESLKLPRRAAQRLIQNAAPAEDFVRALEYTFRIHDQFAAGTLLGDNTVISMPLV